MTPSPVVSSAAYHAANMLLADLRRRLDDALREGVPPSGQFWTQFNRDIEHVRRLLGETND